MLNEDLVRDAVSLLRQYARLHVQRVENLEITGPQRKDWQMTAALVHQLLGGGMKIYRRTFRAALYDKGSYDRECLNQSPLTSEYHKTDKYVTEDGQLFVTKKAAEAYLEDLLHTPLTKTVHEFPVDLRDTYP